MLFTPADRRLIQDIKSDIAAIDDKLDVHALLVEMNGLLKSIIAKQGGMTHEQEAAAVEQGNKIVDKLKGIQSNV